MAMSVYCLIQLVLFIWTCGVETVTDTRPAVLDGKCNPYVDMIFVLDLSSNVPQSEFEIQKRFVHQLLKDHKAPKAAVRVAIMVCGDNYTRMSPFTDDLSHIFLQDINTFEIDTSRHCLENLNLQFKTKSRDGVARQAVLLRGSWNWDLERSRKLTNAAKAEKTVMVVIAIGIKVFDSLSAIQVLATEDATYFVLAKFQDLKDLATVLAKDNCKPISLDLTSETRDQSTVTRTEAPVYRETCIQLTTSMFKRYIPGFGYTRLQCSAAQTLDMNTCTCI